MDRIPYSDRWWRFRGAAGCASPMTMTAHAPERSETLVDHAWMTLGSTPPTALREARLQLHWAAQVASALGKTFITARADDSHPNLGYMSDSGVLMGHATETSPRYCAALEIPTCAIILLDERQTEIDKLDIAGVTLEQAFVWLEHAVRAHSDGSVDAPLDRTLYDIPAHPVGRGEPFRKLDESHLAELHAWYHDANLVLQTFVAGTDGASGVRTWPHHFDIGALVVIDGNDDPETARSVGVGMTPGDAYYDEPYFYVNPYPRPITDVRPTLPGGATWHERDWFGAVLTGTSLASVPQNSQREAVTAYLDSSIRAARQLLRA